MEAIIKQMRENNLRVETEKKVLEMELHKSRNAEN